ncbi:GNAT family N-acetyltransferase, partial [Acinetobacter baumannii]
APACQGRGLAVQATRLALDYGFSVLNLHKIYLIVDRENEKAVHVYAKAGFRQEGVLKEEFFMNGQYRDVIRMGIFQRDHLA